MPVSARPAQAVHTECDYVAVNVASDSTTVYAGPCIYYGATVTTALSAQVLPIHDDTVPIDAFAASAAAGTSHNFASGIKCYTSLVVDPDNAATGNITVYYRPLNV
jgi:hypothetical protein